MLPTPLVPVSVDHALFSAVSLHLAPNEVTQRVFVREELIEKNAGALILNLPWVTATISWPLAIVVLDNAKKQILRILIALGLDQGDRNVRERVWVVQTRLLVVAYCLTEIIPRPPPPPSSSPSSISPLLNFASIQEFGRVFGEGNGAVGLDEIQDWLFDYQRILLEVDFFNAAFETKSVTLADLVLHIRNHWWFLRQPGQILDDNGTARATALYFYLQGLIARAHPQQIEAYIQMERALVALCRMAFCEPAATSTSTWLTAFGALAVAPWTSRDEKRMLYHKELSLLGQAPRSMSSRFTSSCLEPFFHGEEIHRLIEKLWKAPAITDPRVMTLLTDVVAPLYPKFEPNKKHSLIQRLEHATIFNHYQWRKEWLVRIKQGGGDLGRSFSSAENIPDIEDWGKLGLTPPCLQRIIDKGQRDHHLSHYDRWFVYSNMGAIGIQNPVQLHAFFTGGLDHDKDPHEFLSKLNDAALLPPERAQKEALSCAGVRSMGKKGTIPASCALSCEFSSTTECAKAAGLPTGTWFRSAAEFVILSAKKQNKKI